PATTQAIIAASAQTYATRAAPGLLFMPMLPAAVDGRLPAALPFAEDTRAGERPATLSDQERSWRGGWVGGSSATRVEDGVATTTSGIASSTGTTAGGCATTPTGRTR